MSQLSLPEVAVAAVNEPCIGKAAWRAWCRRTGLARSALLRTAHAVRLAGEVLAVVEARQARVIGLYSPIGSEVDTRELANLLLVHGRALAYPRLSGDGETMEFCRCDGPSALISRPRSRLLEPTGEPIDPAELDVMVAPALGISPALVRLGRAGGYFDRYMPRLPDSTLTIAVTPGACVVPWGPRDWHDAAFDAVCTEHGLFGPATAAVEAAVEAAT